MSFAGKKTDDSGPKKPAGTRRASTGSMPDFAFSGPGVRIGAVSPGSPAEAAGLQRGDVIIRLDGRELADLGEYSNALKEHQPGDTVELTYLRDGVEKTVSITLGER